MILNYLLCKMLMKQILNMVSLFVLAVMAVGASAAAPALEADGEDLVINAGG